jgi:hypothetical protein
MPTADAEDIPIKIIDGYAHTTRAGIAQLAGWKPGRSVDVRAGRDPDFPQAAVKDGRHTWYPMDGPGGVAEYLAILEHRAGAKKPPPVKAGDPDDLLDPASAADAMHIARGTLDFYVNLCRPYWAHPHGDGQPHSHTLQLPPPDLESIARRDNGSSYTLRQWRRATLAAHQAARPGPGANAGRPST